MKRQLAIAVLLLIAGAILNLALAWMIAWTQRSTAFGRPLHDFHQWKAADKSLNGSHMSSPGAEWLLATCSPNGFGGPQTGTLQQFLDGLPIWCRAEMQAWCGDVDAPDPPVSSLEVFAAGWPARSFSVVRLGLRGQFEIRGGWSIPRRTTRNVELLPYTPIWRGALVNTILYATALFGVLLLLRVIVQWSRYRRGRCPRCRYDLRSNFAGGCSECGWRRAAVQESVGAPR